MQNEKEITEKPKKRKNLELKTKISFLFLPFLTIALSFLKTFFHQCNHELIVWWIFFFQILKYSLQGLP